MTRPRHEMTALGDVASTLWRIRELLDNVLYKVVVQRLVLGSEQTRWLAGATRELDAALHEFHTAEVLRAAMTDGLAVQLGVGPGGTLAALADAAPEPWATILDEHRDALRALLTDVDAAAMDPAAPLPVDNDPADLGPGDDAVRSVAVQTMARARPSSLVDFLK